MCLAPFKLSLAGRTVESRASRLYDAADCRVASGGAAGRAFAPVDVKAVLKISKFAIGLPEIAQRGAARFDGISQHFADHRNEPRKTVFRHLARWTCGVNF